MSPGYAIRLATAEDIPALPDLERASGHMLIDFGVPESVADEVNDLATLEQARALGRLFIAADAASRPAGFALAEVLDGQAHLAELGVHPEHARRGLGAALLTAFIDWSRAREAVYATLTTYRDIPFNAPFYAKHGFRILAPAEILPELRAQIASEADAGLDPALRVAMRRDL